MPDNLPLLPSILGAKCGIIRSMKHKRFMLALSLIGLAVLSLMLNFTSPTEIGPFGVLLFFTTVYLESFAIVVLVMGKFYEIALRRKDFRKKDYAYAIVASFSSIIFLMVRSFGMVNRWALGVILLFVVLAEFLVYKRV